MFLCVSQFYVVLFVINNNIIAKKCAYMKLYKNVFINYQNCSRKQFDINNIYKFVIFLKIFINFMTIIILHLLIPSF